MKAPSWKAPRSKSVTQYVLDFTKCSLCGSCVEACRDGAIRYSHEYNLASTNKEDYIMDLFKRLEDESQEAERTAQASQACESSGRLARVYPCRPEAAETVLPTPSRATLNRQLSAPDYS